MATRPSMIVQYASRQQGWSERYWYTSVSASLADVALNGLILLNNRKMMLARGTEILNAYASYDDEFRDVKIITVPIPGAGLTWNSALTATQEIPNFSVVLRCTSGVRAGKFIYIAGVPDDDVYYPPLYNPFPNFSEALQNATNDFINALSNGLWGWKARSAVSGTGPTANVTNMVAAGTTWTLTVDNTTGFTLGSRGVLSGVVFTGTSANKVNRVYLITNIIGTDTITLDWGTANYSGILYAGGGKLVQQTISILPIEGVVVDKLGSRKRGVGARKPVGRRRKV